MQLTQAQIDVISTELLMDMLLKLGFEYEISDEMREIFQSTVVIKLTYPEKFFSRYI